MTTHRLPAVLITVLAVGVGCSRPSEAQSPPSATPRTTPVVTATPPKEAAEPAPVKPPDMAVRIRCVIDWTKSGEETVNIEEMCICFAAAVANGAGAAKSTAAEGKFSTEEQAFARDCVVKVADAEQAACVASEKAEGRSGNDCCGNAGCPRDFALGTAKRLGYVK